MVDPVPKEPFDEDALYEMVVVVVVVVVAVVDVKHVHILPQKVTLHYCDQVFVVAADQAVVANAGCIEDKDCLHNFVLD